MLIFDIMKIHQYTSIASLALILKNRTIKFSRLDGMDDIEEEALSSLGIRLGGFVFASCWTYGEKESIPLWKIYTPFLQGVRITMDNDMFKSFPVSQEEIRTYHIACGNEENFSSIIPIAEMFTKDYTILNTFWNNQYFFNKVEYVENIRSVYDSLIELDEKKMNIRMNNVGFFKHTDWNFQEECRFRLIILPNTGISVGDERYASYLMNCIQKEIYAPFNYYFLKLKEEAIDSMTITLSPFSTENDRIRVHNLCHQYAPKAMVTDSSLKNRVRLK